MQYYVRNAMAVLWKVTINQLKADIVVLGKLVLNLVLQK